VSATEPENAVPPSDQGTGERFEKAIFYLDRKVTKAIRRFGLLHDGDRVLVGVSGGKDSLMLLHVLVRRRQWRPERYELVACHVRQEWSSASTSLETLLARECKVLEVPFLCVTADPLPPPEALRAKTAPCLLCSRRRRKALFEAAVAHGCRTVALAHHKEDAAETLLLNLLWQGRCEGLAPRREFFGGVVTVIRPLLLVDEADLARACRLYGFPALTCSCPQAERSRRETAARMLAWARENGARDVAANLLNVSLKLLALGESEVGTARKPRENGPPQLPQVPGKPAGSAPADSDEPG